MPVSPAPHIRLARFLAPLGAVVRHLYPQLRVPFRHVALLGLAAAVLNAAGYVVLYRLVDYLTTSPDSLELGPLQRIPDPALLPITAIILLTLLTGALELRFLLHAKSLALLKRSAAVAAVEGALRLPGIAPADCLGRAVRQVTSQLAHACGFTVRQLALGVADLLQLSLFLLLLFWLSPGLTLVLVALSVVASLLYARSVSKVIAATRKRGGLGQQQRLEQRELVRTLTEPSLSTSARRARVEQIYHEGAAGEALARRIEVRREMKRGPLVIEYLFPAALVLLPAAALATDVWQDMAGRLVVFVLVLRQVVALAQRLAGQLIATFRFHDRLACYAALLEGFFPDCLRADDDGDSWAEEES